MTILFPALVWAQATTKLGVAVRSITAATAERLGTPKDKGVLVEEVKPDSFANEIGLQRGHVIFKLNGQQVNSAEEFQKIVSLLKKGDKVVFLVQSGAGTTASRLFLSGVLR
jgi:serine protease Do